MIVETITLIVGGCDIYLQPSLQYLGIEIDKRLRFNKHFHTNTNSEQNSRKGKSALARILLNVGDPSQIHAAPICSTIMAVT